MLCAVLCAVGCDPKSSTPVIDGAVKDGQTTGDGSTTVDSWTPTNQPACAGTVYACGDGKDNDGDGLIDAQDPECVGPCDNDEGAFATGIAGDNVDGCKQDCFFDGNSGQGEKCEWNLKCDPKNPGANLAKACPYDPAFKNCPGPQPQNCIDNCRPLTPNGCDCFGCCEVFAGGQKRLVYLGSGADCTAATPEKCATCTQSTDCVNDCKECEICLGKTIADLPAKCFASSGDAGPSGDGGRTDGGSGPRLPSCENGLTPCVNNDGCTTGYFCLTGCCTKIPR